MTKNVGSLDRIVRIIAGALLIAFAVMRPDISYSWIGWLGVVPLATGLFSTCPAYSLFGLNTCARGGKIGKV